MSRMGELNRWRSLGDAYRHWFGLMVRARVRSPRQHDGLENRGGTYWPGIIGLGGSVVLVMVIVSLSTVLAWPEARAGRGLWSRLRMVPMSWPTELDFVDEGVGFPFPLLCGNVSDGDASAVPDESDEWEAVEILSGVWCPCNSVYNVCTHKCFLMAGCMHVTSWITH